MQKKHCLFFSKQIYRGGFKFRVFFVKSTAVDLTSSRFMAHFQLNYKTKRPFICELIVMEIMQVLDKTPSKEKK